MKFVKKHLVDLPFCYAAARVDLNGKTHILFAPDAYGRCYIIDIRTFERRTVWESPGGTMTMVPLPDGNGDFLAVQLFNPGFQAKDAQVVLAAFRHGRWQVDTLFKLPYIHRFDILERAGIRYIVCCTVCTTKQSQQDWSSPGEIYARELSANMSGPISLVQIAGNMHKNHGFWRVYHDGSFTSALTSCDEGIFEVMPPEMKGASWQVRKILNRPVSDLALCDIDGDGVPEIAAIEPFHGSEFSVYHRTEEGYAQIYRYPQSLPFCHAIWGGQLRSKPVFICGCRSGKRELILLRWQDDRMLSETIDSGCGPANVTVIGGQDQDMVVAANREVGEGAVYFVQDA